MYEEQLACQMDQSLSHLNEGVNGHLKTVINGTQNVVSMRRCEDTTQRGTS